MSADYSNEFSEARDEKMKQINNNAIPLET